jgi:hypothetical protein
MKKGLIASMREQPKRLSELVGRNYAQVEDACELQFRWSWPRSGLVKGIVEEFHRNFTGF